MNAQIEALYGVFSRYPRPAKLEGCPCCTDAEASRLLCSRPLRALTDSDLGLYTFKSLSTWGTLDDFRYFLPRILELMAHGHVDCDTEVILGKLGYADWTDWPTDEQAAIWRFIEALWIHCIQSHEVHRADAVLCGLSRSAKDISRLLTAADDVSPEFRWAYVNECGRCGKQRLTNSFWDRNSPSYQQAIDWAYAPFESGVGDASNSC